MVISITSKHAPVFQSYQQRIQENISMRVEDHLRMISYSTDQPLFELGQPLPQKSSEYSPLASMYHTLHSYYMLRIGFDPKLSFQKNLLSMISQLFHHHLLELAQRWGDSDQATIDISQEGMDRYYDSQPPAPPPDHPDDDPDPVPNPEDPQLPQPDEPIEDEPTPTPEEPSPYPSFPPIPPYAWERMSPRAREQLERIFGSGHHVDLLV